MNYEKMTLQELKAAAKESGVKKITGLKKSELVALLMQSEQSKESHTEKKVVEKKEPEKKPEPPKPSNEEVLLTEIRDLLKEQK